MREVFPPPPTSDEFYWLGQLHQGAHADHLAWVFDRVQQVFASANRPRHTKTLLEDDQM